MAGQLGVAMTTGDVDSAHQVKTRQRCHKEAKWHFTIYHLTSHNIDDKNYQPDPTVDMSCCTLLTD